MTVTITKKVAAPTHNSAGPDSAPAPPPKKPSAAAKAAAKKHLTKAKAHVHKKPGVKKGTTMGGFKRIADLGEEKVAMLNSLFEKGVSVSKIIQTIQEGWGSMVDVKKDTLSKYLYRYKWEVVDKNLNPTQQLLRNHGDHTTAQVRKAVENLEVLAEMQEIVMVQRRRVKKLLTREDEIPMLFSNMTNELKAFAGFLEQYTNMAFDFGVMKRTPRVTTITKDGHVTTVESEGKEQLAIATENAEEIEDAAKKFFDILHGAIPPGEDHMPEMPNAG